MQHFLYKIPTPFYRVGKISLYPSTWSALSLAVGSEARSWASERGRPGLQVALNRVHHLLALLNGRPLRLQRQRQFVALRTLPLTQPGECRAGKYGCLPQSTWLAGTSKRGVWGIWLAASSEDALAATQCKALGALLLHCLPALLVILRGRRQQPQLVVKGRSRGRAVPCGNNAVDFNTYVMPWCERLPARFVLKTHQLNVHFNFNNK